MKDVVYVWFVAILSLLISFFLVALIYYIVCFSFSLVFTWKYCLGIWVLAIVIKSFIQPVKNNE